MPTRNSCLQHGSQTQVLPASCTSEGGEHVATETDTSTAPAEHAQYRITPWEPTAWAQNQAQPCVACTHRPVHIWHPDHAALALHLTQGKLGAFLTQKHEAGRTAARMICRFQVPAFTTQYKTLKAGLQPLQVCNSAGPALQQAVLGE